MNMTTPETIAGEFQRLDGLRQNRIDASEKFAYFTIPSVFPKDDEGDDSAAVGMLDSIGASVANHFANKLVTTLFSPNRPFFRLAPDPRSNAVKELREATAGDDPTAQQQAKAAMAKLRTKFVTVEKDSVHYLERIGYRTSATNAAKLLIITGDVVIRSFQNEKAVAYTMRDYVCVKDLAGTDIVLIVRDGLVFGALNAEQKALVVQADTKSTMYVASTPITIYTRLELQTDKRYKITKAIDGADLPDENVLVTQKKSEFTHLSWNLTKGQNYGRGLVEDFSGSFHMIDELTNHQARIAAKMADLKIFVDPQSGVDVEHLNASASGTYVAGKPGDVQVMASGLDAGMQYLESILATHKRQISAAFLYQSGQTRDAERVTAEEIRESAAELEIAHGGVYSRFASDWQGKVAYEAVAGTGEDMGDTIEPQIMTGMDSLSRTGEMQSVRVWMNDLGLLNNVPEDVRGWIKPGEFASYAARQRGVDHDIFVKSATDMKAEQDAAAEAEQARVEAEQSAQSNAQAQQTLAQNS
jgi:hypothetical protein